MILGRLNSKSILLMEQSECIEELHYDLEKLIEAY